MKKGTHFFALKEDLLPVLEIIERDYPLKYVRMGNFLKEEFADESFLRGADIPHLGRATAESASSSQAFLVTERDLPINVRFLKTATGIERCLIDQLINPDTVTFLPGGLWKQDVLLYGRVATVSDTLIAKELMKRFQGPIRKQFTKIGMFWVGSRALELLRAGMRLTGAEQSPREYDLRLAK